MNEEQKKQELEKIEKMIMPLEDIKKIYDSQDWKALYEKKSRILITFNYWEVKFQQEANNYITKELLPPVYDKLDEYLVKNDLVIYPYLEFGYYKVCVFDKTQMTDYQNNLRREVPVKLWEHFDKIESIVKDMCEGKVIGQKNFENQPDWVIQAPIKKEILDKYEEARKIKTNVMKKLKEMREEQAKLEEETAKKKQEQEVKEKAQNEDISDL